MLFTMRLVSFICNFWTLALSLLVIYQLGQKTHDARKRREIKRKRLYLSSILFVSVIMVLSIINQICLSVPDYVAVFDFLMEFYLLVSLTFFFWQWKEQILLFVDKNYIYPLQH